MTNSHLNMAYLMLCTLYIEHKIFNIIKYCRCSNDEAAPCFGVFRFMFTDTISLLRIWSKDYEYSQSNYPTTFKVFEFLHKNEIYFAFRIFISIPLTIRYLHLIFGKVLNVIVPYYYKESIKGSNNSCMHFDTTWLEIVPIRKKLLINHIHFLYQIGLRICAS